MDLVDRLAKTYTAVVHDVMRAMGLRDLTLPPEIRPLFPDQVLAGVVATVSGRVDASADGHETLLGWTGLLSKARAGTVLICQPNDSTVAHMGELSGETLMRSRERALAYLKTTKPGKTVQTLALRLIVAHDFGEPEQAELLRRELLDRQNADGGWSWWKENQASDAFATGQALYALGRIGSGGTAVLMVRLLRDGSGPAPLATVTGAGTATSGDGSTQTCSRCHRSR